MIPGKPMTLREKLERLTEFSNRKRICKAAGLSSNVLYGIIVEGKDPCLGTIAAIAKVLGIELSWLVDERASWPPVFTPDRSPEPMAA
jgi:DNA-binding phage protein